MSAPGPEPMETVDSVVRAVMRAVTGAARHSKFDHDGAGGFEVLDGTVDRLRLFCGLAEAAHAGEAGALGDETRMGADGDALAGERFDEAGGKGAVDAIRPGAERRRRRRAGPWSGRRGSPWRSERQRCRPGAAARMAAIGRDSRSR